VVDVPRETPDDLVERYRQTRPFDRAETTLVTALVRRPDRLPRPLEHTLRWALNLARLWILRVDGEDLPVGPKLGAVRARIEALAERIGRLGEDLDPAGLAADAHDLKPHLIEARAQLLLRLADRAPAALVDQQLAEKALVLVTGGGGGSGYVHLGTFALLESLRITPRLVAGSSLGSVLGLFRARDLRYHEEMVRAVTHGLTFKRLFRVLEMESRFGVPGPLRLYLRSALSRFFVGPSGHTLTVGELEIPFICVVSGIRRSLVRRDLSQYEAAFARELRRGAFGALLGVKDLITSWAQLMNDLVTKQGALVPIPIGLDDETRGFDVLDSVGFSCAVPALIHYDILRSDPRMEALMGTFMRRHQVDVLVDGGVSSNVPARFAWEAVQRGRLGTTNAFVLGLDCFAPQLRRNMLFLPIQRVAAQNVERDRAFAQLVFTHRKVPSPAALVPGPRVIGEATADGRDEVGQLAPFLLKMMEPIPAPT
jgi:predicted acylesterase/phospholipase RssA